MDIVEFLSARFDEEYADAIAAQEADPIPWKADTNDGASTGARSGHGAGLVVAADGEALWDCEGSHMLCMTAATARHVARHDPDRVLRELAAKREQLRWISGRLTRRKLAIMDEVDWLLHLDDKDYQLDYSVALAAKTMAVPYAGHPDYSPRWELKQ